MKRMKNKEISLYKVKITLRIHPFNIDYFQCTFNNFKKIIY